VKPVRGRFQRGAALLVMMVLVTLGASWMLLNALGTKANRTAVNRQHNAAVLAEARLALLSWVASQAIESSENNPGRLPCPVAPAYLSNSDPDDDGIAAGSCTLPAVGRLPYRTLGLSKLLDAHGEPLWYVVSSGWALPNSDTLLTINSDTAGQLTVDGQANAAVALIVAPGPAINVTASTNCSARAQTRNATAPDLRDYLECENATSPADATFATSGPTDSFNDQVLKITTADVMPGLEAAIAKRIETQVAPVLKTVYGSTTWGTSAANPAFAFPAPFGDPSASSYQGTSSACDSIWGVTAYCGLLPFNYSNCTPGADPRCTTTLVRWYTWTDPILAVVAGPGVLTSTPSCDFSGGSDGYAYCNGYYNGQAMTVQLTATARNVGMALRQFDLAQTQVWYDDGAIGWTNQGTVSTITGTLATNGRATITATASLPDRTFNPGSYRYRVRVYIEAFADHPILSSTDATTGWFVRNEWYRLLYYAVAPDYTPGGSRSCEDTTPTCLQVTNVPTGKTNKQRAILLLAGRNLSTLSRPSSSLSAYLDSTENRNSDNVYEQLKVNPSFNDRVIVIDENS
jgi:hypothetical protein